MRPSRSHESNGAKKSASNEGADSRADRGRGTMRPVRRDGQAGARAALGTGTLAPTFELNSTPDQKVDLTHFRGRPVVLVFYPADWSPVCGDQLALYNEILSEFDRHAAQLLGISVDGVWCHGAYAQSRKLHFPLLADFEPKGKVARTYGVYREGDGVCERALFVIDGKGVIRWSYVSPLGVNPGANGILNALDAVAEREHSHA